jgi:hypothetical protein
LQIATSPQPFGCVAAYVPRRLPLQSEQITRLSAALGSIGPHLSYKVAEDLEYPLLYEETDWDKVHDKFTRPGAPATEASAGSGAS